MKDQIFMEVIKANVGEFLEKKRGNNDDEVEWETTYIEKCRSPEFG